MQGFFCDASQAIPCSNLAVTRGYYWCHVCEFWNSSCGSPSGFPATYGFQPSGLRGSRRQCRLCWL